MKVIRLPTAAREPVRNPAVYDTAPRRMCEARGYLAAVREALLWCPKLRRAIIATANTPASGAVVDALAVIQAARMEAAA